MKTAAAGIIVAILVLGTTVGNVLAVVVTDNNLTSQSLGSLSNNPGQVSVNFTAPQLQRIAVVANVTNILMGNKANSYYIDAVSSNATASSTNLIAGTKVDWGTTQPSTYSAKHTVVVNTTGAKPAPSLYYNLGVGTSLLNPQIGGYKWVATNVTFYKASGADSGLITSNGVFGPNLVPNASFESTNVSFWPWASFVTTNNAKHGTQVASFSGTSLYGSIPLPVEVGRKYAYSFWYRADASANYGRVEWGLTG